jgi:hypothetical protein
MNADYILRALVRALAYRAVSRLPWWIAAGILLALALASAK